MHFMHTLMNGIVPSRLLSSLIPALMIVSAAKAQITIVPGSGITLTPLQFVQTYLVGPCYGLQRVI